MLEILTDLRIPLWMKFVFDFFAAWDALDRSENFLLAAQPQKRKRGETVKLYNSITGEWVEPAQWQLALKIGDHYAIHPNRIVLGKQYVPVPTVYGCITSDAGCEPGFFFVSAYSQWNPDGEIGGFCICDATHPLTEEQFERAKAEGWPELPEILKSAADGRVA